MGNINIGNNLGILRRQHGITQVKLAEAIDVTTDHIGHVENGDNGLSLPKLTHICRVLGVTPNDYPGRGIQKDRRTGRQLTDYDFNRKCQSRKQNAAKSYLLFHERKKLGISTV